jgi:hypothetical protein
VDRGKKGSKLHVLSEAQGIPLAVALSAWLFGFRRLTVRYERKGSHFLAFLGLAAALTCYKKLAKCTT